MSFIAKSRRSRHPGCCATKLGLTRRDYEGSDVDALRRLRPRLRSRPRSSQACFELDTRRRTVSRSFPASAARRRRPAYFLARRARLQRRARPHAVDRDRAPTRPTATCATSACRATATRCRSASASSRTRSGATSTWSTSSRTTASTASPRASSRHPPTSARSRRSGEANEQQPIDPVLLALALGASFVARSFSGDKEQLVPLIQAGIAHSGFALIDVLVAVRDLQRPRGLDQELSPTCASTARRRSRPTTSRRSRKSACSTRRARPCPSLMHDGSNVVLRKLDPAYDPTDRARKPRGLRAGTRHEERIRHRASSTWTSRAGISMRSTARPRNR